MSFATRLLWCCLALCFFIPRANALVVDSFSAIRHDRFADSASFLGSGLDYSGVGMTDNGRWATMITDQVFLSSQHYNPVVGQTLTFYAGNDPAETPVERIVAGGQRIGSSDLWIGHLSSGTGASIAAYSIFAAPMTTEAEFQASLLWGYKAFLTGRSVTSTDYGGGAVTDQGMGQNFLEGAGTVSDDKGTTDFGLISVEQLSGDLNFIPTDEAQTQGGDSGAPLFGISGGGDLLLIGINWAVGSGTRNTSVFSYPGNYLEEMNAYIVVVPELSSLALAGILLSVLWGFGKWRSRG
jgi:hypothetical protein